jgi:KUP system potassium uptake protein
MSSNGSPPQRRRLAALSLTTLGVVYGDIGTSPLYAFRECFKPAYGLAPTPAVVHGILSLIIWALVLVVTVKYVGFVLRADNRGEGGTFALLALLLRKRPSRPLVALALFGAALLLGEGAITPAISVLSAVEGLEVVAPDLKAGVLPITATILFGLFFVQRWGTAGVGRVFGPVMLVWFATIGVLGALEVAGQPGVLRAVNPWHGLRLFLDHGGQAFVALGAIVLVVTGVEALYADLGHFGRRPIRLVWLAFVLPMLLLNYLGQGALLLRVPEAAANPFYLLAPGWFAYPLLAIATLATIVASQALISGAFSLARQAVRLGYLPRLTVQHTSWSQAGQIYIPEVNAALMVACLLLVAWFGSSSALAAAYGTAVTGTMTITTILLYVVARQRWRWSRARAALLTAGFLAIDGAFLAANLLKIGHGGWVPLVIAGGVFLLMTTWKRGTDLQRFVVGQTVMPLDRFLAEVEAADIARVPGTAVFLTAHPEGTPPVLRQYLKHSKALHEEVIRLSIATRETPAVPDDERIVTEKLAGGFFRVQATYGFMETPDVPAIVRACCDLGVQADPDETSYFLGRARLLPTGPSRMQAWRKLLFAFMARNARSATEYFRIPPDRVVELGARLEF